ncbi:hypothetical protein Tco_1238511, partial [Tanacetum coccineum]
VASSDWPFVSTVLGLMTHLVASLTLDSVPKVTVCMHGCYFLQGGRLQFIPTTFSWGDNISPDEFLAFYSVNYALLLDPLTMGCGYGNCFLQRFRLLKPVQAGQIEFLQDKAFLLGTDSKFHFDSPLATVTTRNTDSVRVSLGLVFLLVLSTFAIRSSLCLHELTGKHYQQLVSDGGLNETWLVSCASSGQIIISDSNSCLLPHDAPNSSYENFLQSQILEKSRGSNSGDGGNTGDGGKIVVGSIGARGDEIGNSLLVASYACMTFIYGSLWKGEMASEAKRYLDKSSEGLGEVFSGTSSHQHDDDDDDDVETSRASTPSPTTYLNSLDPLNY